MTEQKQMEEMESKISQKFESEQESIIINMNEQVEEIKRFMGNLQNEVTLIGFLVKSQNLVDKINKLQSLNRELGESIRTQSKVEKLLKD